ncbi:MAG: tyrosine--tRNA ligase [Gemmatimonadales bacterium]|nr:tyrosine--tRNA ligase [Gemmatimonadales bacterium]
MTLLETLEARGFVQDTTPGLRDRLAQGTVTAYVGFDPTGDSLHVGHLLPVMALGWLQRHGGTPIALVGGGTALVGDPSGKRSERPMLSREQVAANARALAAQLGRFLAFDGPAAARLRDNADWLAGLGFLDFLRDTGKHFTINYMLQKESVRSRMETGISYTEFSYMLVQAYDFLHLHRAEGCALQMGGSDQWGNITAGIELIGRVTGGEAHGLTVPLLLTASGTKFGKTEGGSVWLDPARTSPYAFHQFWLNTDDRDVERLLRLFTFLPLDEVAAVMAAQRADPAARAAQRRLAAEVTTLVHGAAATREAEATARALFAGDASDPALLAAMPTARLAARDPAEVLVVDALIAAGLASSKAEARRGIEQRGYYVNGTAVTSPTARLTEEDVSVADGVRSVIVRKGKKHHVRLLLD